MQRGDDEEMEIVEEWLGSSSFHEHTPIHTFILTGKKHVEELLEGHKVRARREFCMKKKNFCELVEVLHDSNLLANITEVSVEEQLAMFLFCLLTNASNHHSGETISRYFNTVLEANLSLSPRLIQLPSINTPIQISSNPKFMPYFKVTSGIIMLSYLLVNCCY
jgi:hypothetical protein